MPSRTASGSGVRVCGSRVAVAFAASAAVAPAPVKTSVSFSERRLVKIAPKIATPREAPTSRK